MTHPANLNNGELYYRYQHGKPLAAREALTEMARRVGMLPTMMDSRYITDEAYRTATDEDTAYLFRHYKLQGAQNDNW